MCKNQIKDNLHYFLKLIHPDIEDKEISNMQVSVFKAFLDESGIDRRDLCVVAGFLGCVAAQNLLADRWNNVLQKYKVNVPFHAIQFYAPPKEIRQSTTNPYSGWSNLKRARFMDDLLKSIEVADVRPVGCGIDSAAFHSRTEAERMYLTGGALNTLSQKWIYQGKPSAPYFLALRAAIESAAFRANYESKEKRLVQFFMGEQNEYEGGAMKMYRYLLDMKPPLPERHVLMEPMVFGTNKKYPQLQASDLLAYHCLQYLRGYKDGRSRNANPTFKRLMRCGYVGDFLFATAEILDKQCARFTVRKDEFDKSRHLKLTRLRVNASHDLSQCKIIGTVDEGGNFHPLAPGT